MLQALLNRIGGGDRFEGTLEFRDSEGGQWTLGKGEPRAVLQLRNRGVLWRMLRNPQLAFFEAYMDGDWSPGQGGLAGVLDLCSRNAGVFDGPVRRVLAPAWHQLTVERNTPDRSQRNAQHHYDIDFEVYRRFLDDDLHYSCAYFRQGGLGLEAAQQAKCAHIAAKLNLKPGARVLDIGCGWGSLALYLAEHHRVRCLGITLSPEQMRVARQRAVQRGLTSRVEFQLLDYRDLAGRFDAVVSVGMFEHVGRPQFPIFFEAVRNLLVPDGAALLHTIGRRGAPGATHPWIRRHIFPGGYIPAASELFASVEKSGLIATDLEVWRLHYAYTLYHWARRFVRERAAIAARMGERFCRMWELYLESSASAFRHGDLVVFQLQMARELQSLPLTREYQHLPQRQVLPTQIPAARDASARNARGGRTRRM